MKQLPMCVSVLLTLLAMCASVVTQDPGARPKDARKALAEEIEQQLRRGFAAGEPGAAVLGVRDGEVVIRTAFGKANLELDVDLLPTMAFCIASATKRFTATAIMMLVEQGLLSLDEPAAARLDGIDFDQRVTIAHLLSHTSGLPDFFDIEGYGEQSLHRAISAEELCRAVNGQALEFAPGQRESYSNLNYALLARIVEVVSGKPWETLLAERIFAPAGMQHTACGGDRRVITGAVTNYVREGDAWLHAAPLNYTRGFGLGSLFSTLDDLAAFDTALREGKLLKPETIDRMHQPFLLADGSAATRGLGWVITDRKGHRFIHHGGSIHGWRAHIVRLPAERVFVAVLSNRGEERSPVPGIAMTVAAKLAELRR